jgi:protocatechuate 3,4-dioxygenase beta subunit
MKLKRLFTVVVFFLTSCASVQNLPESTPTNARAIPTETPISTATTTAPKSCTPTLDDDVSPSYIAETPIRNVVGQGHVLTGTIRSSVDCRPIPNAKLEFWSEEQGLGHPESSRASFFSDENGQYRFECNPPEHIHMRISAEGFRTIGVNSYHPEGAPTGTFDIVLRPEQ